MTDKSPFDIDRALDDLGAQVRAAAPAPSDALQARVLADAAEVSAGRAAEVPAAAPARPVATPARRWFALPDLWAGAAAAAMVLFLVAGLGLGYQAGDQIMIEAGLGETVVASSAQDAGGLFIPEDVL